ncbi:MAG: hypothetical protein V4507_03740, partial [Verrucomicrobiota bacterium]
MKYQPSFESFLIQNGIVLTESLQKWKRGQPTSTIESLLIDHADEIREDLWIESWTQCTDIPSPTPV